MPVWLITGCSSGFGRELARAVLAREWNAVVTARDPAAVADLVAGHAGTALSLKLDVRDRGQIDAAVREAEARFGAIDVLVNNAGYGYRGAVEEAADSEIRDLYVRSFGQKEAVANAVRRAGGTGIDVGGWLSITFTGTKPLSGGRTLKVYEARYELPTAE